MNEKGLLIVLSGPSGVGKGTVRKALFEQYENEFDYSVSMTTRSQRENEVEGIDYYFRTRSEFERLIETDGLLEYAEYVGNYYGTPLKYVNDTLNRGRDVFLEIEVQGAMKVKEKVPDAVFIFLSPPDLGELKTRIIGRGTDDHDVIERRMEKAIEELKLVKHYDYVVENDTVENATRKIRHIIESEHMKVERVLGEYAETIKELE